MSSLRLTGVGFAHRPDVPLLSSVDLHLQPGITAVVGPNGAGKTTLLRLLAGDLSPTVGQRHGPLPVTLCPQEVGAVDDAVQAFAWGWAGPQSWALQSRLALDPADLERWPTLSPGERKRWQVGAALAAEPAVLLLDEPTNHLDAPTRALLLEALGTFPGIGVVVSHDRALLKTLATAVIRVEGGTATRFPGSWEAARATWEQERAHHLRQVEVATQEARAARRRLADVRRASAQADRQRSVRARSKGLGDSDARSSAAKGRAEHGAARAAHQVTLARRQAEAAHDARAQLHVDKALGAAVQFTARSVRRRLVEVCAPVVAAGARPLLRDVDLWIDAGDRVWLRGPNGTGKSTLVRALLAASTLPDDAVVHLPQVVEGGEVLARVRRLAPDLRGRVLQAVAALGVDPGPLLRSERPSPGEARKLRIAEGLGTGAALLVLDEPTNHLDLPSVERLERALIGFDGAVLLVTHDEDLGGAVATRTWTLADGRVEA